MPSPIFARAVFTALLSSLFFASCTSALSSKEPQTVVLNVEEAPTWAKAGARVEVRDDHDAVLLVSALQASPPVILDVSAPTTAQHLKISVQLEGHEARGDAEIKEGYANCTVR